MTTDLLGCRVLGVQGRPVQDGKKTIYDIQLDDGNVYTTFKQPLAGKASGRYSSPENPILSDARVSVVQNGDYTNFRLEDIAAPGELPAMATPAQGGAPAQQAPTVMAGPSAATHPGEGTATAPNPQQVQNVGAIQKQSRYTPEEEARMSRFAAQERAAILIGALFTGTGMEGANEALPLFYKLTDELVTHGVTGSFNGPTPGVAVETPEAAAAQVNQVLGAGTVQTGAEAGLAGALGG